MRIFVMGASHAGKTPFARRVAEALAIPCVGASAWVRSRFDGPPLAADAGADERARFVDAITRFAVEQLRADPDISAAHLRAALADAPSCVVEGVRNPYDFVTCFDPRSDIAVFLRYLGVDAPGETAFERGLDVIRAYLAWLAAAGLGAPPVHGYDIASFAGDGPGTLDGAVAEFLAAVPRAAPPSAPVRVHAEIPCLATHVRAEYLFGMDPARAGELRPCEAFSISSYRGSAPTFQIRLADGAVFSYLPPTALVDPARAAPPELELGDLVYHDCKSTLICVHAFEALRGPVLAYFKRRDLWLAGDYLFTVDWYDTNELLHGIALANGQYALLPSHKLKFGDHPPGFEPYKKIRREWTAT